MAKECFADSTWAFIQVLIQLLKLGSDFSFCLSVALAHIFSLLVQKDFR